MIVGEHYFYVGLIIEVIIINYVYQRNDFYNLNTNSYDFNFIMLSSRKPLQIS